MGTGTLLRGARAFLLHPTRGRGLALRIRIVKTVPGYVCGRTCNPGDMLVFPTGVALSLVGGGYAEVVREVPAEQRETATVKRAGRPRKGG